ncbi:MAG: hypothetical protein DI536_22245 [Archangium gephyra]|uniref:Uncharacterized protein n=1 Tax=Archangium gephyra TaxID=48 RepID=A0A2W5TD44_9BACT|nr:MAG: hypothetical protein DI536_22245 [Archangium gephyra]
MTLFKRLSLVFAVLAAGGLFALWAAQRAVATNVMNDQTAPVRAKYVADWEAHADAFGRHLVVANAWLPESRPTPVSMGCQVPWSGDSTAVQRHRERCATRGRVELEQVEALEALAGSLLTDASAPKIEDDLSWLKDLRGHADWLQEAGTPLEFFDTDVKNLSALDVPVLDARQVKALAARRLLEGLQHGALDEAVTDVTALAQALLGRPVLLDQLLGVELVRTLRTELGNAGKPELAPSEEVVEALRQTRLASALLWHPWTPGALPTRFSADLSPASRCAASAEAAIHEELGASLGEFYRPWLDALHALRVQHPCTADFTTRLVAARAQVPQEASRRLLRATELLSTDELRNALLLRAADSNELVRKAAVESYLAVTLPRPFPETEAKTNK